MSNETARNGKGEPMRNRVQDEVHTPDAGKDHTPNSGTANDLWTSQGVGGWRRLDWIELPDGRRITPPARIWRNPEGDLVSEAGYPVCCVHGKFETGLTYLLEVWANIDGLLPDVTTIKASLKKLRLRLRETIDTLKDDEGICPFYRAEWDIPATMSAEERKRMDELIAGWEEQLSAVVEVSYGPLAMSRLWFVDLLEKNCGIPPDLLEMRHDGP
jgi:hypothetical protein